MSRNPRPIESLLLPLKPESLQCLHRFMEHPRTPQTRRFPKRRTAAVAIVLFIGRLGDIYVLLSTRAGTLRSYAHDTALPGGKHEAGDADEEGTARREAFEEIGLPMDRETVRCLCMLDPFLTGNDLIVTPVVLLVTDNAINPVLNPDEVTHLFSMPLAAFLYARPSQIPGWHFGIYERLYPFLPDLAQVPPPPPIPYAEENTVDITGEGGKYYEYRDVKWGEGTVRMHRFLTGREGGGVKPVYGLTANILIHAAMVGYDQRPAFDVYAPDQRPMVERILHAARQPGALRRAIEAEELWDDWQDSRAKL